MCEVSRRPADATANIKNAALVCKCDPLNLIACGGEAPRMEMLKTSKDFRIQFLWVVSQISQRAVDPRKHARSRPMGLNVRWLRHGPFLVGLNEGSIVLIAKKVPACGRVFSTPNIPQAAGRGVSEDKWRHIKRGPSPQSRWAQNVAARLCD
jgi:hypothetical protein